METGRLLISQHGPRPVVDLSGRLSNPLVRDTVEQAARAVEGITAQPGHHAATRPAGGPWRLVDRLGEQVILELLRERRRGTSQRALAQRYGISLSSVKRLVRHPATHGSRTDD